MALGRRFVVHRTRWEGKSMPSTGIDFDFRIAALGGNFGTQPLDHFRGRVLILFRASKIQAGVGALGG